MLVNGVLVIAESIEMFRFKIGLEDSENIHILQTALYSYTFFPTKSLFGKELSLVTHVILIL